MKPTNFGSQDCADRKRIDRKEMIREKDSTKDYDDGDSDSPWKTDGEAECVSHPGGVKLLCH